MSGGFHDKNKRSFMYKKTESGIDHFTPESRGIPDNTLLTD